MGGLSLLIHLMTKVPEWIDAGRRIVHDKGDRSAQIGMLDSGFGDKGHLDVSSFRERFLLCHNHIGAGCCV